MSPKDGLDEAARLLSLRLEAGAAKLFPSLSADRRSDLVQRSIVRIWPRLERGEVPTAPPTSYLLRTLYSCFVDDHRRPRTQREITTDEDSPQGVSSEPDPEARAMSQEIRQAFRDCLQALPPGRQDAVPLRLLGHSYREVADLLGCDVKAADNWINRGLGDLRRCLEEKGIEP